MALTLLEAAKALQGQDIRQALIEIFASNHPLLQVLPFENITGNSIAFNREGTLPGTGFRAINSAYTESTGKLDPVVEKLFFSGGDLDVDSMILKTMGEGQRSTQENMKAKALSHNWAHKFIKGSNQSDSKEFDGLQVRAQGSQVISNAVGVNGGALSLAKLDEAIDQTVGGNWLLMSRAMLRKFSAALRGTTVAGNINQTRPEFGTPLTTYNGIPIITMDDPDQLNATLTNDEAYTGGGTADGTSIYVCAFGEGKLTGIQHSIPSVDDLGQLQEKPSVRTRFDWAAGIGQWHNRAITRLRDIDSALALVA